MGVGFILLLLWLFYFILFFLRKFRKKKKKSITRTLGLMNIFFKAFQLSEAKNNKRVRSKLQFDTASAAVITRSN